LNSVEKGGCKSVATINNPAYPFFDNVGAFTPDHDVQARNREAGDQNRRHDAEERENDEHLPSDLAPGFLYVSEELHWLP
jgi:hypothetical protein